MKRREFVKNASAISALSLLPPVNLSNLKSLKIIKPERLHTGDTIGLVAPGGYISQEELHLSRKNIEELGFKVFYTEHILKRTGYLAGKDEERAADLMQMFADKKIKGIICARGGYGCARILPIIDYRIISENPKALIGYSDVTALFYGIFSQTGLITFHGPVGISTYNDFSRVYFNSILVNPGENIKLMNEETNQVNTKPVTIRGGKTQGTLIGGNLSIVVSLIGTDYDVDTSGKIIFLEEIGEEPYRIDRMLTQMIHAGKFKDAVGIALGVFEKCEPKESDPSFSYSLVEVLYDRLYNLGIPVIYGLSFGHIVNKFTIPAGVNAELDADNQTLTLLEPAVL